MATQIDYTYDDSHKLQLYHNYDNDFKITMFNQYNTYNNDNDYKL